MKSKKRNLNGIVLSVFEIAIGILLLINPIDFTKSIIIAGGAALLALGIFCCVKYFRTEAAEAATGQYLLKGLIAVFAGIFCVLKADLLIITFPALTILYGIVVLVTGLSKVQLTVDMLRRKSEKWLWAMGSALLATACGLIILSSPFSSTEVLWIFTAITLIVEAVMDIITWYLSSKEIKAAEEKEEDQKD